MQKKKIVLVLALFLSLLPLINAADNQYKPYLHKANIPDNPKPKLYGSYSTNLFPGAATYSYQIEIPKGTNNLQPSLTVSYNSQSMKQRSSILGAGWSITQNYIYRDTNYTPSNVTDDLFKLILNGASYDLIYDNNDGSYHTKTETFARIQNLTTITNSNAIYWLVTLKDGTQLRFGYNSDSELASNVGYSYSVKWGLDQVTDLHNNKIFYSYLENPNPEDIGTSYLSQITYNNDQKRKISFAYESSVRLDRRMVYESGNRLDESRRLSNIYVYFNETLVRRYDFEFISLNNESSLSSLSKIKYVGSDGDSVLHTISFDYYQPTSLYDTSATMNISSLFSNSNGEDYGIRLVDLNNDGLIDILQGRQNSNEKTAWLNNRTSWINVSPLYTVPVEFVTGATGTDTGLRIGDLNNDGFPDLIQGNGDSRSAWLMNGTKWYTNSSWAPLVDFVSSNVDQGTQLVDFNGDGRLDILQKKDGSASAAYLNTGEGWKDVSSIWIVPANFTKSTGEDYGLRLVDLNGDGLVDLLQGYNFGTDTRNAWLNNGSGWVNAPQWVPPDVFTSTARVDNGIRLIDLNGDGLTDLWQDFRVNGSNPDKEATLNTGNGWKNNTYWNSPEGFTKSGKNVNRRIGDVNGDGFGDIIVGDNNGTDNRLTQVRNFTIPYLLKNITNEFGGITTINYTPSTVYNNTNDDGISDLGFSLWVVNGIIQNNSLSNDFGVMSNTSYSYFGGFFDYNISEFRGFNIVNEIFSDKSTTKHYFSQSDILKGKEYKTEMYSKDNALISKSENNFNFTFKNPGYYVVTLGSAASYLYDGASNSVTTNSSFIYDNYSNVISRTSYGDISVSGDEKYENYTYLYNISSWILDKVSWYFLFDSNYNKVRESKNFYDEHEYGSPPSKGDLTKTESWLNTGSGNPTTRFKYDDYGNLVETTDALGRVTKIEYGLRDETRTYPERIINSLGHKTDFVYDVATGNVLQETKNGISKYLFYDVFGRITKEVMPYDSEDLPTKSYIYNLDGVAPEYITIKQKTTSNKTIDVLYVYDGFSNPVQIKSLASDGQVVKNLFYDGLFRVSSEQNLYFDVRNDTLTSPSPSVPRTQYFYDSLGRVTSVINPDNTAKNTTYSKWEINDYDENANKHTYLLDSYGRIIAVTEYNKDFYLGINETYNTTYGYNSADELTGIRDAYGNNFNFTYDSLGRKVRLDDPDLGTWNYEYDLAGNLVRQRDNNGNSIRLGYDSLNRILQKNTSKEAITFGYDVQYQGTLSNISYGNGTFSYTYDDRLRVIREDLNLRGFKYTTGSVYDSMDRILKRTLPDSTDLDLYYNEQGKIDKIKGFINKTNYNAFGNPLNRTYFNSKITTFDYYPLNARLRQIKTDTVQNLNYTYDNVGNILSINDSANNRTYRMSYDNLDRLTNVSINNFRWVYSYDAIGNILKIVRNTSQSTFLKYNGNIPHAPSSVITTGTGVDVYKQDIVATSNKSKVVNFFIVNDKNTSLNNVSWTAEFNDNNIITSNVAFNLNKSENALVIVENSYSRGGNYKINLTGTANGASDFEPLQLAFGAIANSISALKQNATLIVTEFSVQNTLSDLSQNWGWNCSNGVISTKAFNMSGNQSLMIIMEYNYSLNGGVNITCKINSSDGNQSRTLITNFDGIKIENYNSTIVDSDTILVKFNVKNYYSNLNNIKWNITANGNRYNDTISSISQGLSSSVSQEINFTNGGLKKVQTTIGFGNFTDTYTEYYYIKWIDLNQFYSTLKNATTRIFDFIITNRNSINTTAFFNISQPVLNYTMNLTSNESLIVIVEQDFSQGDKTMNVKVFNRTLQEDNLIEVFKIRQIQISKLETLFESTSRNIVSAQIVDNTQPLNIGWKLNNTETVINSTLNLSLSTSQSALVIIESNFSSSGIYPLNFVINSSTYNDNATGVAVS